MKQSSLRLSVDHDLSRFPRLQFGLAFIRANGPVASEEIGRAWRLERVPYDIKGFHVYDRDSGMEIGKSLRKRGLVRYRQKAGWYALQPGTDKPWRPPAEEGDIPF